RDSARAVLSPVLCLVRRHDDGAPSVAGPGIGTPDGRDPVPRAGAADGSGLRSRRANGRDAGAAGGAGARRAMRKTTGTVTRKLYIKTYGCQMNVYDSGRMAEVLAPLGYAETGTVEEADMILLNTCHIREKAAEKLFSDLGRLRPLKARKAEDGGRLVLAVAGCVAQAEGAEILSRAPFVDLVLGPQTYHRLPEMVAKLLRGEGPVLDTEFPAEPKFDFLPRDETPQGIAAFLSVQEGCDKFC